MSINLTELCQALIGLLSALVTVELIPWIKAKTNAQNAETKKALVRTLVFAAEQILKNAGGENKLAFVKRELEKRGMTIDDAAIEAAVLEMNFFTRCNEENVGYAMDGNS